MLFFMFLYPFLFYDYEFGVTRDNSTCTAEPCVVFPIGKLHRAKCVIVMRETLINLRNHHS